MRLEVGWWYVERETGKPWFVTAIHQDPDGSVTLVDRRRNIDDPDDLGGSPRRVSLAGFQAGFEDPK